jgi:hypothetical protein
MNDRELERPPSFLHRDVIAPKARARPHRSAFLGIPEHLNSSNPAASAWLNRVSTARSVGFGGHVAHGHPAALKALGPLSLRQRRRKRRPMPYSSSCSASPSLPAMVQSMRKIVPMAEPSADAH